MVITQPHLSDLHVQQQVVLRAVLESRFGEQDLLTYVNLGNAIDMQDRSIVYDGLQVVAHGDHVIADHLPAAVRPLLN